MSRSLFGEEAISRTYGRYIELSALIQSFVYGLWIAGAIAALYFLDAPAIWWAPVVVGVAAVLCTHAVHMGTTLIGAQVKVSTDYAIAANQEEIANLRSRLSHGVREMRDELQQIREEISARDV